MSERGQLAKAESTKDGEFTSRIRILEFRTCQQGVMTDVDTSENWAPSYSDRFGNNNATRKTTEEADYSARSFPYPDK